MKVETIKLQKGDKVIICNKGDEKVWKKKGFKEYVKEAKSAAKNK